MLAAASCKSFSKLFNVSFVSFSLGWVKSIATTGNLHKVTNFGYQYYPRLIRQTKFLKLLSNYSKAVNTVTIGDISAPFCIFQIKEKKEEGRSDSESKSNHHEHYNSPTERSKQRRGVRRAIFNPSTLTGFRTDRRTRGLSLGQTLSLSLLGG